MWDLGAEISYDEATQGFTGRHYLKAKIKYKKAGDGYLIDCVGDDGLILHFISVLILPLRNGLTWVSTQHMHGFYFSLINYQVDTTHVT